MRKLPLIIVLALTAFAVRAQAVTVKIADITRLGGQRNSKLLGLGLVYGLKGTGDGGDYAPAIKPLATMLGKFADKSTLEELSKTSNVALVSLTATIPSTGVREGDHLDVRVASIGDATNIHGQLFICPLVAPGSNAMFAWADGTVEVEDPTTPTVGVIYGGAVMEQDLNMTPVNEAGRFSLILESPSANWTTAHLIAQTINGAESLKGEEVATAIDAKEIVVTIPKAELDHPDSFISRVQQLPVIMLDTEARVKINEKKKSIVVTGDVTISPVVISQKGLTIETVTPAPVGRPGAPVTTSKQSIAIDPSHEGGARLQDLVSAMEQLRVPAEDRISIVRELYAAGKLHAKLIEESN